MDASHKRTPCQAQGSSWLQDDRRTPRKKHKSHNDLCARRHAPPQVHLVLRCRALQLAQAARCTVKKDGHQTTNSPHLHPHHPLATELAPDSSASARLVSSTLAHRCSASLTLLTHLSTHTTAAHHRMDGSTRWQRGCERARAMKPADCKRSELELADYDRSELGLVDCEPMARRANPLIVSRLRALRAHWVLSNARPSRAK